MIMSGFDRDLRNRWGNPVKRCSKTHATKLGQVVTFIEVRYPGSAEKADSGVTYSSRLCKIPARLKVYMLLLHKLAEEQDWDTALGCLADWWSHSGASRLHLGFIEESDAIVSKHLLDGSHICIRNCYHNTSSKIAYAAIK